MEELLLKIKRLICLSTTKTQLIKDFEKLLKEEGIEL